MRNALNLCRYLILSAAMLLACAGAVRADGEPFKIAQDRGGGMQKIDPPVTGTVPRDGSILDTIDDSKWGRANEPSRPPEKPVAPAPKPAAATGAAPQVDCPACDARAKVVAAKQAELDAATTELERERRNYTETVVVLQGQDRRVAQDPAIVKQRMDLVAQTEMMIQRQGATVRKLEQEVEALRRGLDGCNKSCAPPPKPMGDPPPKLGVGAGCGWEMPKPITIGPRATYGYTDELKAAEVGKAAAGILGGFLGGRGGMGSNSGGVMGGGMLGGLSPLPAGGGDKPRLATDPVRDKQTFTDPQTGTSIKVGSQYRPDGKLLVSINVDKAEDKGVVHQAALERVQYLPSGECGAQAIVPVEWVHYDIWEDWWAKIRIRTYVSTDGGPWRQTSDTGWRDWGSGSRLIESGTMAADKIPGTAWGSMGADRAFGGPRGAGAVFDAGKPLIVDKPSPERLVIYVSQPGKDPVSTVPFALYPTYGAAGKVTYTDKAPDVSAILRGMRPDAGGGMQRIDPPATGQPAATEGSILDSIDAGAGKTPLAK